jgi:tetratricopeptide (TPR) repeat protein
MAWWKRRDQSGRADGTAPAGDWRDDPRVGRVAELTEQALELQRLGHIEKALSGAQEGVALGRELVRAYPEPVHLQELAGMLYGLAGILNRVGRPAEAVDVLEESLEAYGQVAAAGVDGVAPLIADVRARQATSLAHLGRTTSAVVRSDLAVAAYRDLAQEPGGQGRLADLVRVLGVNAQVLVLGGDPDVACASADEAIRTFTRNWTAFERMPQAAAYLTMLSSSCGLAGRIHAANGRLEPALAADEVGARVTRLLVEYGGDAHRDLYAAAVARHGAHLLAAGQAAAGAARLREARSIDTPAADEELAEIHDTRGEADRFCLTLGFALRQAAELGVDGVDGVLDLTADEPGSEVVTPSLRCAPDLATERAETLGRVALATLPAAPAEGLRIGFEAHLMFALISERGGGESPFWPELLDALIAEAGEELLGDDIFTWQARSHRRRPSA